MTEQARDPRLDHSVYCCIEPGERDEPSPDCPGFFALMAQSNRTVTIPTRPASLEDALAAFQAELPSVAKNKTAVVKGETRDLKPFNYTYKYADYADVAKTVMPLLGKHGLSFTAQPTMRDNGQFGLAYQLLHTSGQRIEGWFPLDASKKMQTIGGDITYARRYCLSSVTGVAAEEDTDAQGLDQGPPVAELKERLRATRRADPEVDEHGAATVAEQTRMITGPEPGTWRLPTTPVNDPFYDTEPQPQAAPDETTYDTSGTITRAQLTKIAVLFGELGYAREQRADRLALASRITGRPLRSSADLSKVEAGKLIEAIERSGTDYERLSASLDALEAPAAQPSPPAIPPAAPQVTTPDTSDSSDTETT